MRRDGRRLLRRLPRSTAHEPDQHESGGESGTVGRNQLSDGLGKDSLGERITPDLIRARG